MTTQIEFGDYVKHKDPMINGNLRMTVDDVNDDSAQCSHRVVGETDSKLSWFKFEDLELVKKADASFLNM